MLKQTEERKKERQKERREKKIPMAGHTMRR